MKKIISIFSLLLGVAAGNAQTELMLKYGTNGVKANISIYQNGERVANYYSQDQVSLAGLQPGIYTYKTGTNHLGTIDTRLTGNTLELDCARLAVLVTDAQKAPLQNEMIEIYEDGELIQSMNTDANGECSFYLKPSTKYAYKSRCGSGSVEIPEGKEGETVNLALEGYQKIQITAKYKDFPVEGRFTLYPYGDTTHPIGTMAYTNENSGKMNFDIITGNSYWLETGYGTFSQPYTPTPDNSTFSLEHYKVTFVSNSSDPNILKEIEVAGENFSESKVTDGKGYAVFYLIPGTYSYSHLNGNGTFTVENSDKTINLASYQQTITFMNPSGRPYKDLHVQTRDQEGAYAGVEINHVTDEYGQCTITRSEGTCLYLDVEEAISGYPIYTFQDTTLYLVDCAFTSNLSEDDRIYVSGNKCAAYINSGECIQILQGEYTYTHYHGNNALLSNKPFTAETDVHINEELKSLTVNMRYKNGDQITGNSNTIQLYKDGVLYESKTLDGNGKAVFYIPNGEYEVSGYPQTRRTAVEVIGNTALDLTVPNPVTLNITDNGQPFNGTVFFTQNLPNWEFNGNCANGKLSIPLEEGEAYYVMPNNTSSVFYNKADVSNGMSLDFVDVEITAEGPGLTFPLIYNQDVVAQKYIVGNTIRLYAVPMEGYRCAYWNINGTHYETDMIEFQINGNTTAIACFEPTSGTDVKKTAINDMDIRIADQTIYFPETIEGTVNIYSTSGILEKSLFVVSDKMGIEDLRPGVYVLSLKTSKGVFSTKFTL